MEKGKQRTVALGLVAVAVAAYGIPHVLNGNDSSSSSKVATTSSSKGDSGSGIKENKASANKKSGNKVNNEKLELDNLTQQSYALQSATQEVSPFASPTTINPKTDNNQKKLPDSVSVGHIENNISAFPQTTPTLNPSKPNSGNTNLKLKAVAQSNDRIIAVIEDGGKRTSAFVGTTIGNYTVTNIDSEHAYLQSNDGYAMTLDLTK